MSQSNLHIEDKVQILDLKVDLLVRKFIELSEKVYFYEKENKNQQERILQLELELEKLKSPQKNVKIVEGLVEEDESIKEVKTKLDAYIELLDQSIAQLEK